MWLLFLCSFMMWLWANLVLQLLQWTCNLCQFPSWCDICHSTDNLASNWWWSFLVILKTCIPSDFHFYSNHKWNLSHVIFLLDVTYVIQWTPWLQVDDKDFLGVIKTCSPSDFPFTVITNEIGVMSYSFLMWHLSYSRHLGFELMIKFFLWLLKLVFWAIFVFQ